MNEPPTRAHLPPAPYPPPPSSQRGRWSAASGSHTVSSGGGRSPYASPYASNPGAPTSTDDSRHRHHQRGYVLYGAGGSASAASGSSGSLSSSAGRLYDGTGGGGGGMGSSARGAGKRLPARVAFVPGAPCSDLYGAVNCAPAPVAGGSEAAATTLGGGQSKASRLKFGPPLLEVRRLKYSLHVPGERSDRGDSKDDDEEEADNSGRTNNKKSPLVRHETILVSRGIPGLGGNLASTCLEFCPLSSDSHSPGSVVRCATGLTSGALCLHSLSHLYSADGEENGEVPSSTVAHYAPRQQRPATAVAWRPDNGHGGERALVAVGLAGGGGQGGGGGGSVAPPSAIGAGGTAALPSAGASGISSSSVASLGGAGVAAASGTGAGMGGAAASDRDFGVLVWDVEAQASAAAAPSPAGGGRRAGTAAVKVPAYRFAHASGAESLAWLADGRLLAVGCHRRSLHLYDLRVSGERSPPVSVFAHSEAVAGVIPDPHATTALATFGRNAGEPVKLWDARMMDATLAEIAVPPSAHGGGVGAVAWSAARPGVLSIAVGNSVREYDARSPGSRALPVGVTYVEAGSGDERDVHLQCLAFQPQAFRAGPSTVHSPTESAGLKVMNPFELYPHRALAVSSRGRIDVIPEYHAAPLAISKRDGRVATGLGGTVWIGPTTDGPAAMEGKAILSEDVSARMMRRARCFHASRYSTDADDNVSLLEEERERILAEEHASLSDKEGTSRPSSSKEFTDAISNIDQLLHCWRWIALVERLGIDHRVDEQGMLNADDLIAWPAKGLVDAGALKLLRMSSRDAAEEGGNWMDTKGTSDALHCDVFDSPMRRAALNACGWTKKFGVLQDLLDECEARGDFERSAALAVWHGDLDSCVAALQRGAEDVRALVEEGGCEGGHSAETNGESYSETLSLIAMCVAGFNVTAADDGTKKTTKIWSSACDNLLRRSDISETESSSPGLPGAAYLRAILVFLQHIGSDAGGFDKTIYNEGLSLADRVGFACRFLPRAELHSFLDTSMRQCIKLGRLEGLLITGLSKLGIGLLQSYMDRTSDVQTAALISCRVVLPLDWSNERRMCMEWLESYRLLLNNLQMWHSRAAFDVGRFEHLRRLKQGGGIALAPGGRQSALAKKQQQKDKAQASNFPPQLWARCNYCNASLPLSKLRRQEGIANSWLSRQKPVLSCCPQCKKPLPRCSICLLSLGCLNPYMELQRERNQYPRSGSGGGGGNIQDLSGLASIPFATWFSWCMRCKHGGHAHHLCAWFEKHSTCAVSGCDCQCQFDGIEKLSRPGLQ